MSDEKIEKELGAKYLCFYCLGVSSEGLEEIEELLQEIEGIGIRSPHPEVESLYDIAAPKGVGRSWNLARVALRLHSRPFIGLRSGLLSATPDPERIHRLAGFERHAGAVQYGLSPILDSVRESIRSAHSYSPVVRGQQGAEAADELGDDLDRESADDEQLAEIRAALNESRQLGKRAQQGIDALVERAS